MSRRENVVIEVGMVMIVVRDKIGFVMRMRISEEKLVEGMLV